MKNGEFTCAVLAFIIFFISAMVFFVIIMTPNTGGGSPGVG